MRRLLTRCTLLSFILTAFYATAFAGPPKDAGFVRLFDGKTLNGWKLHNGAGPGYVVHEGGIIVCPADGGGDLLTEKEYSDFVFRFDFKLAKSGNNGVGIRVPPEGHPSYKGMELQILDDRDPMYKDIKPWQAHGSVYGVVPAVRDKLKPVGQWNHEEVTAIGRKIKIVVNGATIIDCNLNDVHDPAVLAEHPGLLRDSGTIGFLGHGPAEVQFKDIWIKDLSKPEKENTPPPGFTALFNGKDLTGWKALVGDPPKRAKMTPQELAAAIAKANIEAFKHWTVQDGLIHYDGKNDSLCTIKDYGDFEMLVDWKIPPKGDSGIYLRGSPQVQIWDPAAHPARDEKERGIGSGGLYNNQKGPHDPLFTADRPVGEWNRFRIVMVGEKVHVFLNGRLVVDNVTLENYWERDKPIYPTGQIELQHHGDQLWFKNIYVRELPRGMGPSIYRDATPANPHDVVRK